MKNERISRIYIFYVNEFKLAQYARDTGKVSLFYNKRKTTKRVFGFMEVKNVFGHFIYEKSEWTSCKY